MHCTQQYVVSLDQKLNADSNGVNAMAFYRHLWLLERILLLVGNLQTKRNFKPQNALKHLKHLLQNEAESVPFRMRDGANVFMTGGSFTSQ